MKIFLFLLSILFLIISFGQTQKVVISKLDNKVIALTSKYGFGFKILANYLISPDQVRGKIQANSQFGTDSPYNSYLNYTYFVGSNMHKNPDKKFVANVIIVDAVTMKSFNSARFNAEVKYLLEPDDSDADVVVDGYRANTVGRKDGDLEIKHHKERGTAEAVYNSNDGNYNRGSNIIFIDKEPDYATLPADLMTVLTKKGAALMSTSGSEVPEFMSDKGDVAPADDTKTDDNQNPVIVSDFCYNEIPPGVQLVQTESEWLMLSKTKACCCYPSFNSQNKSLGLLYNYKAYALIKQKLLNDQEGITVCSKEDWGNILKQIEQNHQMIQTLQFNDYPGYYDEDWYTPELGFSAYWLDENSMYTFSKQTYGEPMLDDQLFDERQRTCALSIRIVKSSKINCNKKKWLNDPIYYRGENNNKGENNIKFVSKVQDWIKNSNDGIASCCYLNFDNNNQSYGFLYNYAAYILLKLKPIVYAEENLRVATEIDWNKLISCYGVSEDKIGGSFAESLGGLAPNGFFDGNFWHMPEDDKSLESKCSFWVGENSSNTYTFVDPENYKGNPWPENVSVDKDLKALQDKVDEQQEKVNSFKDCTEEQETTLETCKKQLKEAQALLNSLKSKVTKHKAAKEAESKGSQK